MYLSKIAFRPTLASQQALLNLGRNGAYASHQLLWKLFTEDNERKFLFREEQEPLGSSLKGAPVFFVLSEQQPIMESELFTIQAKSFAPKLSIGDRLAFKLRANPTISVRVEGEKRSKRHDVLMHAKYLAKTQGVTDQTLINHKMEQAAKIWLADPQRLERMGMSLDVVPDVESYQQQKWTKNRDKNEISYSSVDYQGVLTVQSPERFLKTLLSGIGKSKAFGCGLMLVRRA